MISYVYFHTLNICYAQPQLVPRDLKVHIGENSPVHVAVAKIVSMLDDRKIKLRAALKKLDVPGDGSISFTDLPKGLAAIGIYISAARAAKMVAHFDRNGDGRLHYHDFVRLLSATRAESHEEKTGVVAAPEGQPTSQRLVASAASEEGGDGLTAAGTEEGGAGECDVESVSDILAAISYSVYSTMRGARKAFKVLDSAGDKRVNKEEMGAGLCRVGVECSSAELDAIFERFDVNHSGALSFDQFVKLLAAVEPDGI